VSAYWRALVLPLVNLLVLATGAVAAACAGLAAALCLVGLPALRPAGTATPLAVPAEPTVRSI